MTDGLVIRTNNVPREIIDGWQLTEKEREQFDYIDWDKIEEGSDSASFFRYKGELYDLHEFMPAPYPEWNGYQSWSFSNGLFVKFVTRDYDEMVVVAYYYVKG